MPKFLNNVRSWLNRVGCRMLYGGTRSPFSPNAGTEMQLMSSIFSPTLVPSRLGLHVYTGARPLPPPDATGPITSAVPKYAAEIPLLAASPLKLSRKGIPLAIDEMPETCHPFRTPRPTGLFIGPFAASGRNAFQDTFRMCV